MLSLLAPALLTGCAHHHHKARAEAKQIGLKEADYCKLKTDAEAGDKGAAEKLARLWYQYSEDTTKALYWLEVAANNGSKNAAKVAEFAKSQLGNAPKIAEE
jgi:hypothetical protein